MQIVYRITLSIGFMSIFIINPLNAQDVEDVIYLKDGSVIRGEIIEFVPEDYYKIRITGGSELVFKINEISKITKESKAEYKATEGNIESWYFHIALGGSENSYPDELQVILDELEKLPGVDHVSVSIDIGFYWPMSNNKTVLGIAISGYGDRYEVVGEDMQINHSLYAFSAVHYPINFIGRGVFLRGDIGVATLGVTSSLGVDETSDTGFGFLLGGGYSWQITSGTRLDIMLGFGSKTIESENYSTTSFNVGLLF